MFVIVAAAAALASAPSVTQAELDACLGITGALMNRTALAEERARLGEAAWQDGCRQAREATARRLSLMTVLRRTGASPVGGYAPARNLLLSATQTQHPDTKRLFELAAEDQMARESLSGVGGTISKGLSPLGRRLYDGLVARDAVQADTNSREWLRATVKRRGWFTISHDGIAADAAAQLIVQHADEDLAFKGEMIALIEPLVEQGESRRNFFPFMYDRWAAAAHKPLRFGLQGACKGKGVWELLPTEDPEHLEERRQTFGLESFALQQNRENARCP